MRRYLLGSIFSIALLMANSASATGILGGHGEPSRPDGRPGIIGLFFGDHAPPQEFEHRPFPLPFELPGFSPPFDWPRLSEWRENHSLEDLLPWQEGFPLFGHLPLDSFRKACNYEDHATSNSPVPEPTTALMFGAGLLGLGLARRRQR